jgi:2EXR family
MEPASTAVMLNPGRQFHRFEKLPTELQFIIWGYATQNLESGIVKIGLKRETTYGTNATYAAKYPIPALLQTCSDSRIIASKTYKPYFTKTIQVPVYFHPEKDTLFVEGEYLMDPYEIGTLLREAKDIRFLALRVLYPHLLLLSTYVAHLENLKELVMEWPDHDQYITRDLIKVCFHHMWIYAREVEDQVNEEREEEEDVVVVEEEAEEEDAEEEGQEETFMEPFTITLLTDSEFTGKFGVPFQIVP